MSRHRDRRRAARWVLAAVIGAALGACYEDVKVVQGTVVAVEASGKTLALRDERPPHGVATYGGVEAAAVAVDDTVRLAFREHADGRQVLRLMNLTRHRARERTEKK